MSRTARRTRPAVTDPGELLLFVTEPQQLDAVFEYGTETLSPVSIRIPAHDPVAERAAASGCPGCINAAHRH